MNEDKGKIIISVKPSINLLLSETKGKHHFAAWYYLLGKLDPCGKNQIVTFPMDDKLLLIGAAELVAIGLLKPYRNLANKFILSKEHAFASYESDLCKASQSE